MATFRIYGRACCSKAMIIVPRKRIKIVHSRLWHRDIVQQDMLWRPCQPGWYFRVVEHLAQGVAVATIHFHIFSARSITCNITGLAYKNITRVETMSEALMMSKVA